METLTVLYMMVFLKIPPIAMMVLLWWAAREKPAEEDEGGGSKKCPEDGLRPSGGAPRPRGGCGYRVSREPSSDREILGSSF